MIEHTGPEPWAMQTVDTIALIQPTGASYSYKALSFGKTKLQQSNPLAQKQSRMRPVVVIIYFFPIGVFDVTNEISDMVEGKRPP
ncbi:unnamed protein product [Thlaspi arvense]|uniref:Uncharacterized protein n=1 Tax=Thlaspi arvense TaxID=13288 RepID=A0AAU9SI21_THLAR|nr:unnamed protein product [Thlaspi arvense]